MNEIIILWGHPRSLSTVFERIFIERGDFEVFHEPFAYTFYLHDKKAVCPHWEIIEDHPRDYEGVKNMLLKAAEKKPVYSKDLTYHVPDYLKFDHDFFKRCLNTFVIREPRKTLLSLYKCHPEAMLEETGYQREMELIHLEMVLKGKPPVVVDADDLEDNPDGIIRAYNEAIGIEHDPRTLEWDQKDVPKLWIQWEEWHKDAIKSTKIVKNMETFDFDLDDKPNLRKWYEMCLPLYNEMKKYCIKPT